ncbi:MAG: hypothetical protein WKF84_00485 [Pyrinomonadaceae bacterium]
MASIFVSRVDTKIDKLLEAKIAETQDEGEREQLRALLGQTAIANAKVMYERYLELYGDANARWQGAQSKGREPATPAVGFDQHEESCVTRYLLRRSADRPRHC